MSIQKINPRTSVLLFFVILATLLRLFTAAEEHSSFILGLTPLGAMAIFGGAYFKGLVKPFLFTLLPLFISSIILSFTVYSDHRDGLLYPGWYWVHAAFALMVLWSKLIAKKITVLNISITILLATVTHWLVANLGDCLASASEQSFVQLFLSRLSSGIAYELKFLLGTSVYSLLMFGGFEILQRKFSALRMNPSAS